MTKKKEETQKRGCGILLHISSLPSVYGIGDFGEGAYRFVDFLAETRQSFWQILPLSPVSSVMSNSPYSSFSAFAGNYLFINPDLLAKEGFISKSDLEGRPSFSNEKVDYNAVGEYKTKILRLAYQKYKNKIGKDKDFQAFYAKNSHWLDDYSLFVAIKEHHNGAMWSNWPKELRDRKKTAIDAIKQKLGERIFLEFFLQYLFFRQWTALKSYCNSKNIKIIGDIPIYVSYDSSDVWVNPKIFKLDEQKKPVFVAGVPPDFFSSTGQLWGNPVYRWDILKKETYSWWIGRFAHNLTLYDIIRVDHFRGFVGFWQVPAEEKTAVKGKWVKVAAKDFFSKLLKHFPHMPLIAEDLGVITDDVREVMHQFNIPGMKLLIFAFDDKPAQHPYMPHNHVKNCLVYTGTHDNNTVRGWFEKEARPEDRGRVLRYIGRDVPPHEIGWEFVRIAMMSVADTIILPLQDVLGLGEEGRMNRPGTTENNWQWRLSADAINPSVVARLKEATEIYGRC